MALQETVRCVTTLESRRESYRLIEIGYLEVIPQQLQYILEAKVYTKVDANYSLLDKHKSYRCLLFFSPSNNKYI